MGAIVVRNGRNYIVPLPDLSKTPTQALFGLGDEEHNRAKMRRELYGSEPPARAFEQPWFPELKQRRTYTDAELRKARDSYLRELGFAYLNRLKRPKKVSDAADAEGGGKCAAFFDPRSGRTAGPYDLSAAGIEAMQKLKGWQCMPCDSASAARNWMDQKRRSEPKGGPAAPDAKGSSRSGADPVERLFV